MLSKTSNQCHSRSQPLTPPSEKPASGFWVFSWELPLWRLPAAALTVLLKFKFLNSGSGFLTFKSASPPVAL